MPTRPAIAARIQTLHPAYFALVMATGILGISASYEGMRTLAVALTWVNTAAFLVLVLLTLARVVLFTDVLTRDLGAFDRGPGFFTIVAGICVLGDQWVTVRGNWTAGLVLWLAAIPVWAFFMYAVFTLFIVWEEKPSLAQGIHGGWLTIVVATQAISASGALLAPGLPGPGHRAEVLFFCLLMWLCGGVLYIWLISLILYRYLFFRFTPSDFTPPSWIDMGAMAISTLAGALLIDRAETSSFLAGMLPFLRGFTLLFWATATWWLPMLVILELWRHVWKRFPLTYDPLYWGLVFPIGMYSACTSRLLKVMDLPFLWWIPRVFVYIALAAWLAVFAGLLRRLASVLRGTAPDSSM